MEKLLQMLQNLQIFLIFLYINIVEKSSGTPTNIKGNPENCLEDSITVKNLFKEYENHPSIINTKNRNLAKNPVKLVLQQ